MTDMMVLRVLLAILGGTQILRAEPSPSPTVKSAGSSLASVVAGSSKPTRAWDKPYFDDISPRNVTAIVGQKAVLSCHVKHPGNRTMKPRECGKRDLLEPLHTETIYSKDSNICHMNEKSGTNVYCCQERCNTEFSRDTCKMYLSANAVPHPMAQRYKGACAAPNEVYNKCSNPCRIRKCDSPTGPGHGGGRCPTLCAEGCECRSGFYRRKDGKCVRWKEC